MYADRYSSWLEVAKLKRKNCNAVQEALFRWFMTFGVPTEISADGGPPLNSIAYKTLLRRWDVKPRQSSAHYAQRNGRAEAAVKSVKRILRENINPVMGELNRESAVRAILSHRNTPAQETGISPARPQRN